MNACTKAHRPFEDSGKIFFIAAVHHRAGRVIHRSKKHPGERECYIVFWVCKFAPLVLLQSPHAFNIHQVWPGTSHYGWSNGAMKINEHLPLRCFTTNFVIEVDYWLIIALHEINFDPFHSPFLRLVESRLQIDRQASSTPPKE